MKIASAAFLIALVACEPTSRADPPMPSALPAATCSVPPPSVPAYEVHFSPHGGCTSAVVSLIVSARSSVRVQAYSFTSAAVADALAAARQRGVRVELVADRSDVQGASAPRLQQLKAAGVAVSIDAKHAIAHNKVLIVDGTRVETGSFNYTANAEASNAENCLIVSDATLAVAYDANWQAHRAHSTAY